MPAAAAPTSAEAATIAGFLPPISVIAGRANGPSAKRRPSARPTSAEPVKTTPSIAPSRAPGPSPRRRAPATTTPSGSPAATKHSPTSAPDKRRLLRRLDDHGVARDQRARGHADDERDGEVERADDAEDAERAQDALVRLLGRELPERDPVAAVALHLLAVGLDQVDRLLHLGDRLRAALARLRLRRRRPSPCGARRSPRRRAAAAAQRSDGAVRRQATCAARARSIASATSSGGAA